MEHEPQTTDENNYTELAAQQPEKHPVFQVTTVSRYLALALFVVLPFLGGYVGYQLVPEKVVEVDKIIYEEIIIEKELVNRAELLSSQKEFADKYSLAFDSEQNVSHDIFELANPETQDSLVKYTDGDLEIGIRYNRGWGDPHYRLSEFDELKNGIEYGVPYPCFLSCNVPTYSGFIAFHEPMSKDELINMYMSERENFGNPRCKDVQLNKSTEGIFCRTDGVGLDYEIVFLQGKNRSYEIHDRECNDFVSSENKICQLMADSIVLK